jgi:hypothetical protein
MGPTPVPGVAPGLAQTQPTLDQPNQPTTIWRRTKPANVPGAVLHEFVQQASRYSLVQASLTNLVRHIGWPEGYSKADRDLAKVTEKYPDRIEKHVELENRIADLATLVAQLQQAQDENMAEFDRAMKELETMTAKYIETGHGYIELYDASMLSYATSKHKADFDTIKELLIAQAELRSQCFELPD